MCGSGEGSVVGSSMSAKKLSLLLSQSCDNVGDWVDKGMVGSSKGFDRRPRVFVNGVDEVAIGAM